MNEPSALSAFSYLYRRYLDSKDMDGSVYFNVIQDAKPIPIESAICLPNGFDTCTIAIMIMRKTVFVAIISVLSSSFIFFYQAYTSDAHRWSSDNWVWSLFSLSNFFPPFVLSILLSVLFKVILTRLLQSSSYCLLLQLRMLGRLRLVYIVAFS